MVIGVSSKLTAVSRPKRGTLTERSCVDESPIDFEVRYYKISTETTKWDTSKLKDSW